MMPDGLDLTKLRAFVTVAEYLHFGRAADALHLTQPGLSRQIQTLERAARGTAAGPRPPQRRAHGRRKAAA